MVALAVLLSLAELVNWWSVLVLPAVVAGLVKINDVVAGAFARSPTSIRRCGSHRARGVGAAAAASAAGGRGSRRGATELGRAGRGADHGPADASAAAIGEPVAAVRAADLDRVRAPERDESARFAPSGT